MPNQPKGLLERQRIADLSHQLVRKAGVLGTFWVFTEQLLQPGSRLLRLRMISALVSSIVYQDLIQTEGLNG